MTNQEINQQRVNDYTTHFSLSEFACKCGEYCDGHPDTINIDLLEYLELIRAYFGGKALNVTSCLRCPTHNANVGGVSDSRHLYGLACDFYISGVDPAEIVAYRTSLPLYRYAYAINRYVGGSVHLDVTYVPREETDTDTTEIEPLSTTAVRVQMGIATGGDITTIENKLTELLIDFTTSGGYVTTDLPVTAGDQKLLVALCAELGIPCEIFYEAEETDTDLAVALAKIDTLEAANAAIMTENAAYRELIASINAMTNL